jgi:hypothetical protein
MKRTEASRPPPPPRPASEPPPLRFSPAVATLTAIRRPAFLVARNAPTPHALVSSVIVSVAAMTVGGRVAYTSKENGRAGIGTGISP